MDNYLKKLIAEGEKSSILTLNTAFRTAERLPGR